MSLTSQTAAVAFPPLATIVSTTPAAAVSSMSETTTCAPSLAKRSALALPIPDPAAVMSATLFSSRLNAALLHRGVPPWLHRVVLRWSRPDFVFQAEGDTAQVHRNDGV